MDGWLIPFQVSACWASFQKAGPVLAGTCAHACLTSKHPAMRALRDPGQVIADVGATETLYIEGHGKQGSEYIYEESPKHNQVEGPNTEYMDCWRLARLLKQHGFKGGHIRLHVCHSAEQNSFGVHLRTALNQYGIPFASIKGKIGDVSDADLFAGYQSLP